MGLNFGFDSPFFALPLVFTLIVAYDAMGLRMQSGKQAEAINLIVDELFSNDIKVNFGKLKEELGHKPLEVVGGIMLGTEAVKKTLIQRINGSNGKEK